MADRRGNAGSGCLTAFVAFIGVFVLVLGLISFYLVSSGRIVEYLPLLSGILPEEMIERYTIDEPQTIEQGNTTLSPRSFSAYSFSELAEISQRISLASSPEEARNIARNFNLCMADGSLTQEVLLAKLDDGTVFEVKLAGILHDDRSDGTGKAGLSFIAGAVSMQSMNEMASSQGGWESSKMRAWLNSELFDLLPDDLAQHLVRVDKRSNNFGGLTLEEYYSHSLSDIVTQTSDTLWLFSAHEVCGDSPWFVGEYRPGYFEAEGFEELLNAEGEQYEIFSQAKVSKDTRSPEVLTYSYKGSVCSWWYRTPHPFSTHDTREDDVFYQVMSNGFPYSLASANSDAGVVVGFCL